MRIWILLIAIITVNPVKSQPSNYIDSNNFQEAYLEHLVKIKIDALRKTYKCEPLINDSSLFLASNHHAKYMMNGKSLTHFELEYEKTKSPQDRIVFYGANLSFVGENVLKVSFDSNYKGKQGLKLKTNTYSDLAAAIVDMWENSPGHFKNIITPDYQLTGVSLAVDLKSQMVYACQTFAKANYKYTFTENQTMFPYSEYTAPPTVSSFEGVSDKLIPYSYEYGLKHDMPSLCDRCIEIVQDKPHITLKIKKDNFILKVENAEYVKKILSGQKDGFAVEIVKFDDYMCGNPAYYLKPSRRNGQLVLDGKITEPLLLNDLMKGFKTRSKRKDINFIKYILKADSIKFFNRFSRFKLDKYDYKYFEINLGKVPKNISGIWTYDLVYIQDKQICHIDYLSQYCGELFNVYQPTEFIPASSDGSYTFKSENKEIKFTIPFEKGKSEYTKEDITPFIQSIKDLSYHIDSLKIDAYSSIEGDSIINQNLQEKRAASVANALKNNQHDLFKVSIHTGTNWKSFYKEIQKHPDWKHLAKLSKSEVIEQLNKIESSEIDDILAKQRLADVTIYYNIPVEKKTITYYINKELKMLDSTIRQNQSRSIISSTELQSFDKLYGYIHHLVVKGEISATFLAEISPPRNYTNSIDFTEKFILYGYEFKNEFKANNTWSKSYMTNEKYLLDSFYNSLTDQFKYNSSRNLTEKLIKGEDSDLLQLQEILKKLEMLDDFYNKDSIAKINIESLNFNLNNYLINKVFIKDPIKYSDEAMRSIIQLYEFYERHETLTKEKSISLAKCAVYYENEEQAIELIEPYDHEDAVIAFQMALKYRHYQRGTLDDYYTELMRLSTEMNPNAWCNMFMTSCQISFQAFDNKDLRDIFCEKCMNENEEIKKLLIESE
jgi:uncharacterized protein YkwD